MYRIATRLSARRTARPAPTPAMIAVVMAPARNNHAQAWAFKRVLFRWKARASARRSPSTRKLDKPQATYQPLPVYLQQTYAATRVPMPLDASEPGWRNNDVHELSTLLLGCVLAIKKQIARQCVHSVKNLNSRWPTCHDCDKNLTISEGTRPFDGLPHSIASTWLLYGETIYTVLISIARRRLGRKRVEPAGLLRPRFPRSPQSRFRSGYPNSATPLLGQMTLRSVARDSTWRERPSDVIEEAPVVCLRAGEVILRNGQV